LLRTFLSNVHKGGYVDPGITDQLRLVLDNPSGGNGVYQVMFKVGKHKKVHGAMVAPPPSSPAQSPRASEAQLGGGWGLSMLQGVLAVLEALRVEDSELDDIRAKLGGDVDPSTPFSPAKNRQALSAGASARKQRLRTLSVDAVANPNEHFRRFMAIAGDGENWLQQEADKEFDALVQMVEDVEKLTAGGSDTISLLSAASNMRSLAQNAAQGAAAGVQAGVSLNSPIHIGQLGITAKSKAQGASPPAGRSLQRQDSFLTQPKATSVLCPVPMGKFVGRLVRHLEWAMTTRLPLQVEGVWTGAGSGEHEEQSVEEEVVLVKIMRRIVQRHKEDEDAAGGGDGGGGTGAGGGDGGNWFSAGNPIDPAFMHRLRQNELDSWGVTNAMLTILAAPQLQHRTQVSHGHQVVQGSEELVDEALLMLTALLDGGNEQVQATIDYVLTGGAGSSTNDAAGTAPKKKADNGTEGGKKSGGAKKGGGTPCLQRTDRMFQLIRERINDAVHVLAELREQEALARAAADAGAVGLGGADELIGHGHILYDPRARLLRIFDVMQLMCENHHRRLQDLLRTQVGLQVGQASRDVNLIKVAALALASECADERAVRYKRHSDMPMLIAAVNFLTECMQGPCPENQALVSSLAAESAKRLIKESVKISNDEQGGGSNLVAEVKGAVMKMVCAMLEGRADVDSRFVHHQLVDKLGTPTLKHRLGEVYLRLVYLRTIVRPTRSSGASSGSLSSMIKALRSGALSVLPSNVSCNAVSNWCLRGMGFPEETSASAWKTANAADLEQQYDDVLEEGFNLYAMILQLGAVRADVLAEIVPTEDEVLRHTKYAAAYKFFRRKVRTIEVYWRGSVQLLPFLMPDVVEIADDRAQQMMSTIDLGIGGTDKKKLLEFVEECEVLSDELGYFTKLSNSLFYQVS
jgi:hypothetical protein